MNPNRKPRGRHRAAAPVVVRSSRRRGVRMPRIRSLMSAVVALSLGVGGAVAAAGGSYAYLSTTVSYGGGTIEAGTASLALTRAGGAATSALEIPAAVSAGMLPGDIVNQSITLTNTGDTSLLVTAQVDDDGAWETRVAAGNCPASEPLGSAALGSAPVGYATLASAQSSTFCLQLMLPTTAPASAMGTSLVSTLTFDGTEVAP